MRAHGLVSSGIRDGRVVYRSDIDIHPDGIDASLAVGYLYDKTIAPVVIGKRSVADALRRPCATGAGCTVTGCTADAPGQSICIPVRGIDRQAERSRRAV